MRVSTWRFHGHAGSRSEIRRLLEGRWVELQRAVEAVEEGLTMGCLPAPVAATLIRRIEKRGASRLSLAVSHVR